MTLVETDGLLCEPSHPVPGLWRARQAGDRAVVMARGCFPPVRIFLHAKEGEAGGDGAVVMARDCFRPGSPIRIFLSRAYTLTLRAEPDS